MLSHLGKYVFLVENGANKSEIKKALEEIYKVKVVKVNTINARPNPHRYKKAVVTLQSGQKLDILPQ